MFANVNNKKSLNMNIINEKHEMIDGKLTRIEVPHKFFLFSVISCICRFLFELLHYQHYKQTWNGKKRLRTIKITGIRSALVDDISQRTRVVFYWKIGKYYL